MARKAFNLGPSPAAFFGGIGLRGFGTVQSHRQPSMFGHVGKHRRSGYTGRHRAASGGYTGRHRAG